MALVGQAIDHRRRRGLGKALNILMAVRADHHRIDHA